jgi:hypothetical protein
MATIRRPSAARARGLLHFQRRSGGPKGRKRSGSRRIIAHQLHKPCRATAGDGIAATVTPKTKYSFPTWPKISMEPDLKMRVIAAASAFSLRFATPVLRFGESRRIKARLSRGDHALRYEGPHRLTQRRPPTPVLVLQSLAAAEITNIRHSRDFRCSSIFDFFNSICPITEVRC